MPTSPESLNPPCPQLPKITSPLPITHTRPHRKSCTTKYHTACLELAQSLWHTGSPAQAILQLDKSFMANCPDHHTTYTAILWIIHHSPSNQFLGNPVRHFQHLASRMNMSQPNAELRIWRAWACLHLTETHTPANQHPRDQQQIEKESLTIPDTKTTLKNISQLGAPQEADFLLKSLKN